MAVYKRKDGYGYTADLFDGKVRVARRTFATKLEAKTWYKAQAGDLLRGELRIRSRKTPPLLFRDLANLFLDDRVNRKNRTYKGYRCRLASVIVPAFGDRPAALITRGEVLDWRSARLHSTGHPAQLNHDMDILRAVLYFGVERNLIPANPAARIRHEHEPAVISRRFFTQVEIDDLLSKLDPTTEDHGLVLTAFLTGMRPAELTAFRFEWVDWARDVINIPNTIEFSPKSHKPRTIPLLPRLRDWLEARDRRAGPVFCTLLPGSRGGKPLKSVGKRAIRIRELTGTKFDLYDARHTFASQLLDAGVPLTEVQAVMGHATITTTMRYAHLSPNYLSNVRAALAATTGGGNSAPVEPRPLRVVGGTASTPAAQISTPRAPREPVSGRRSKR